VVKINEYIESGILESYVLGAASKEEAEELLFLKAKHPEIRDALFDLEIDLEHIAHQMAISPPPNVWLRIEDNINELKKTAQPEALIVRRGSKSTDSAREKEEQFISVEGSSDQMRVHKAWRWVLLGIFILGKIFLGFAIYFYLQTKEDEREIQALKSELNIQQRHK
jgi:hypothetical protein